MSFWLSLLILAASPDAPMEHPGAEVVYQTRFEQGDDINFDGWPDEWTRRRGPGFPLYVNIAIADDPDTPPSQCLRITLDGGAASVYSPPIAIEPHYTYVLQGRLRATQLQRDQVYLSLTFSPAPNEKEDEDRNKNENENESKSKNGNGDKAPAESEQKEVHLSSKFTDVPVWTQVEIGPVTPNDLGARKATIGLHVIPVGRPDLRGVVLFDDLRLLRLPQLAITSPNKQNIFLDPQDVTFSCAAAGLGQSNPAVHWELFDATGRSVATETQTAPSVHADPQPTTSGEAQPPDAEEPTPVRIPATPSHPTNVTWHPPVPGKGFFTVRATWQHEDGHQLQQSVSFIVTRPCTTPLRGDFGWSMPSDNVPIQNGDLLKLLPLARVSWLKYALPTDAQNDSALDELAAFADQLKAQNVELVGTFAAVPASARQALIGKEQPTLADLFLRPDLWEKWLDALTSRFASRINYWQLGADGDDCFLDVDGLDRIVPAVRQHLEAAGSRSQVGLAWQWTQMWPAATGTPAPSFLSLAESPDFTHSELERYVDGARASDVIWFAVRPLSRREYSQDERIRDLVLRLMTAKTRNKSVVFVTDPFDDDHGLFQRDGTPSELLLPWTTTAEQLSGAGYLGRLQLPGDSPNCVFGRGDEAIVVVWNDEPTRESLRLGARVTPIDVWGQTLPVADATSANSVQTIPADRLPLFLTGLPLPLGRWQVSCSWTPLRLASVVGLKQAARVRFHNPFPRDVRGTVTIQPPRHWRISRTSFPIQLAANESQELLFDVVLQSDASAGVQQVALDFAIETDRPYTFRVEHHVEVGVGDIFVQVDTWRDREGRLIVEQHLVNTTPRALSFNCYLYAPGRRRVRHQVLNLTAGTNNHAFVLTDGQELAGQPLWLRVEEIGGVRTLNYEIPSPP